MYVSGVARCVTALYYHINNEDSLVLHYHDTENNHNMINYWLLAKSVAMVTIIRVKLMVMYGRTRWYLLENIYFSTFMF